MATTIDLKYQVFKDGLINKALEHYRQPREEVVNAYFFKGKCRPWSLAMSEAFPELTFRTGFYGHNEHMWCTTPDGTIIDPTVEQFYEPAWGGDPTKYRLFDEEVDEIYLGKCMNCGSELYGLKAQGRMNICPPEEGVDEEESECARQISDYYNAMTERR